jgi:hypothetical protein
MKDDVLILARLAVIDHALARKAFLAAFDHAVAASTALHPVFARRAPVPPEEEGRGVLSPDGRRSGDRP